jgi:hypothetical protein
VVFSNVVIDGDRKLKLPDVDHISMEASSVKFSLLVFLAVLQYCHRRSTKRVKPTCHRTRYFSFLHRRQRRRPSVISGFRRGVDEIRALLRYYSALSDTSVPTFRDNQSGPFSRVKKSKKTPEDGTDRVSRNVSTELSLNAA